MKVVDDMGFVLEGQLLTVFIPATKRALVFRVQARNNEGMEWYTYGTIPTTTSDSLSTLDGSSATPSATGTLPSRAYTTGEKYSLTGAERETDMWYLPAKDYPDVLMHVQQFVTPRFLRVDVQIPINVTQPRFQRDEKMLGVDEDFGWARGYTEVVHFPDVHYGYRYCNDTNMEWYTSVDWAYAEYFVDIPKDPMLIYNVLNRKAYSKWITMPIMNYESRVKSALVDAYGIEGFPLIMNQSQAVNEYQKILEEAKI